MNGFEWVRARRETDPTQHPDRPAAFDLILDACLEDMRLHHATVAACIAKFPAYAAELCPLLEMAATMDSIPPIGPTLGFRQSTRRHLMNLPDPQGPSLIAGIRTVLTSGALRLIALAAALTLILAAVTTIADASQPILPGSPLYSLKRQTENVQLFFQTDQTSQALTHAAFAHRRVEEAQILATAGQTQLAEQATAEYGEQVTLALENLRSGAPDAIQPSAEQLQAQLQREQLELVRSQARASGAGKQVLAHALELSTQAAEQLALVAPLK